MKLFTRFRIVALMAVCAVMWAGSAWADANSVVQAIKNYGLSANAEGDTVTVTGTKNNAASTLELGDISGLTIDWQATLVCTDADALAANNRENRHHLITMSGNGAFNITGGAIKLSGGTPPVAPDGYEHWPRMVNLGNDVKATVSGGTVEMLLDDGCAIADRGNNNSARITINGGTISAPNGFAAFATTVTVSNSSNLDLVGVVQNNFDSKLDVYGDVTFKTAFEDSDEEYEEDDGDFTLTVKGSASLTMEADFILGAGSVIRIESAGKLIIARGATLDNDGTVDNDGIIDIYGTVTHPDKLTGTVNDYTGASADVNSVVQAIENYGLIAKAEEKTITVTGNADKSASDVLRLGDITGLVIDWKAELTVTGGRRPSKGIGMINFNNGEFKLTGGAIQLPASANGWVDGIYANGAATVTVDGGKVTGNRAEDNGISVEDGELIINSGEINIPRGNMLFAKKLTVNDPNVMTGIAFEGDTTSYVAAIYGHAATVLDSEVFPAENEGGDDWPESISYVVEDGATWDIEGVTSDMTAFHMIGNMTVKTGGTLNLKKTTLKSDGTLIIEPGAEVNLDQDSLLRFKRIIVGTPSNSTGSMSVAMSDPDKGVLNNSGALSIPAGGTLTNEGIINNKSTGAIVNDGTFTNNGEFNAEPGSRVEGNGERNGANADDVKSGDSTSSGSGGCNTGLGLFGLSLAGIAARKCRKV